MAFARTLVGPLGFGELLSYPLATDMGRKVMDDEFDAWCLTGSLTSRPKPKAAARPKKKK